MPEDPALAVVIAVWPVPVSGRPPAHSRHRKTIRRATQIHEFTRSARGNRRHRGGLKKQLPPFLPERGQPTCHNCGQQSNKQRDLTMQQQESPPSSLIGPQAFKDTLYGDTETGWLTVFYTPSRRTLWFPVSEPMPELDLNQNCYLGLGLRRQRPHGGRARGQKPRCCRRPRTMAGPRL